MGKGRNIHLFVEIGEHRVHGLVDVDQASMCMISISTIRELGLMHLVVGFKN
jgi:hypothetical protein